MTSISLVGCATTTKDEQGSVLMEDVIVQRTTVRSTKENPTPKKGGNVTIQGDNINIGTIIVNSPNAHVDNSVKSVQVQQNYEPKYYQDPINTIDIGFKGPMDRIPRPVRQENFHNDRDFFRNVDSMLIRIIPSLLMMQR